MMKLLRVEFDSIWLYLHRNDEELSVQIIIDNLDKDNEAKVIRNGTTFLELSFDENIIECEKLQEKIKDIWGKHYNDGNVDKVVNFSVADIPEKNDGSDVYGENDENDENNEFILDDDDDIEEDNENDTDIEKSREKLRQLIEDTLAGNVNSPAQTLKKIDDLVGAKEYKTLMHEIDSISGEILRTRTLNVLTNVCYLYSINDGDGFSTYVQLFKSLLKEKYFYGRKVSVYERKLEEYKESSEPFANVYHFIQRSFSKDINILCIDISVWMNRLYSGYFKNFLRDLDKAGEENIYIFRVPFVEKDILNDIERSLNDVMTVRTLSFPPLNSEEIKSFAKKELKKYNYSITENAWGYFARRITEEKSDGKFYGFNTISKIVRELIYNKHVKNANSQEKSSSIEESDAIELCKNKDNAFLTGEELLNRLVGVDGIKQRIREIIAQIELSIRTAEDRPCIHMRFVGNPGTGKTTVARIIGKILAERGILRVGAFFEHSGRDFCGRYIGETAPITQTICRDAYGSVLFIDEAYSLYRGKDDTKDFGREALDTLIAEMENHRNDLVVIMAGYTKDIETLMEGNAGLRSRMPYLIEFPNFTRTQLFEIFVSMTQKYKIEENFLEPVKKYFEEIPDNVINSKEFANARFVRNLVERICAKAALRVQLNDEQELILILDDFEHAVTDKEFAIIQKKNLIGF